MRIVRNAVLSCLVGVCALSGALATPRHELKRLPAGTKGFIQAPTGSTMAGLGVGNSTKFAYTNSWATSDGLVCDGFVDEFKTDFIFYTDEMLEDVFGFYSLTNKSVTVSILVKDSTGATAYQDSFAGAPEPDLVNYIVWPIGVLPAGNYKILVKAKQGATTVGGSYWITVSPPPAQ